VQTILPGPGFGWKQKGITRFRAWKIRAIQIEEILTQRRIDQALDQWMSTRANSPVSFADATLRDSTLE